VLAEKAAAWPTDVATDRPSCRASSATSSTKAAARLTVVLTAWLTADVTVEAVLRTVVATLATVLRTAVLAAEAALLIAVVAVVTVLRTVLLTEVTALETALLIRLNRLGAGGVGGRGAGLTRTGAGAGAGAGRAGACLERPAQLGFTERVATTAMRSRPLGPHRTPTCQGRDYGRMLLIESWPMALAFLMARYSPFVPNQGLATRNPSPSHCGSSRTKREHPPSALSF